MVTSGQTKVLKCATAVLGRGGCEKRRKEKRPYSADVKDNNTFCTDGLVLKLGEMFHVMREGVEEVEAD